ncbi:MAG: DUF4397 domain-containing protein [Deltaproteobacteria bacterium]|nr:DUF4397 domain-containing protein [Deltaproteobacteria bacterium]
MKKLSRLAIAVLALSGCQVVAGVEDRVVDPIKGGCTLPSGGNAKIRFVNLVPDDAPVDVCVRQSGSDFARPILRGGGSACPSGFSYTQASAPFGVQSGKVDLKVVPAGSTCGGKTLAKIDGVPIAPGSSTTIARVGNEKLGQTMRAYVDAGADVASGRARFRVIHASPGSGKMSIGVATEPRLPADMKTPILAAPLDYLEGTTAQTKTAFGSMTPEGYIEVPGTALNVGAAPEGQTKATVVTPLPGTEAARTVFLIGDPAKPYFPVRALTCVDAERSEESPLLTKCAPSALGTLSVVSVNAFLYGSFADDEAVRRPFVLDTLAKHDADLMCITAISRKSDRDALVEKAKAAGIYAYSITAESTLDTPPTEPANQSGATPKPYDVPACGGTNKQEEIDAAMACVMAKCSTTGTPDGILKGGSECISSSCAGSFIPLLAGDLNQKRCFNCLVISSLSDETHGQTKNICTTDLRDYKAFLGQTSSMVLSRFPLSDVETYYLPSTSYQRVVHYAKAEHEPGKKIDFFCGELTAAFGTLVPYHGFYAPDATKDPWFQEQMWQAQRSIEYVKKKAADRPAIITGEWAVSKGYTSPDGKIKIDEQNGAVLDLLEKTFVHAVPPGFTPICTECAAGGGGGGPANPYNGDLNIWQFHTYLWKLDASYAVETNLRFTDFMVTTPEGAKRPISDRWGFETKIRRP